MHQAISEQGRWLKAVVTGYFAYHAVPTHSRALGAFRHHVTGLWLRTLRRRSQRDRLTPERMAKIADDLPSNTQGRRRMPELGTYGSVRGVPSNGHPYRDQNTPARSISSAARRIRLPWQMRLGGTVDAVQVAADSKDHIKRSQVPCRGGLGQEKGCLIPILHPHPDQLPHAAEGVIPNSVTTGAAASCCLTRRQTGRFRTCGAAGLRWNPIRPERRTHASSGAPHACRANTLPHALLRRKPPIACHRKCPRVSTPLNW